MTERVLPREFPIVPEFLIPLSRDELQELGTFAAIWSQIDTLIMMLTAHLMKTEFIQIEILMENMTTGPRINALKKLCSNTKDPTDQAIKKLCEENSGLIDSRNHIIHGLWSIEWGDPDWIPKAACSYQKKLNKPILATKLKELSDRAAKFSNELGQLLEKKNPQFRGKRPRRVFFGEGQGETPPPPQWPPAPKEQPA